MLAVVVTGRQGLNEVVAKDQAGAGCHAANTPQPKVRMHNGDGKHRCCSDPQPQVDSDGLSALSCALVSAKSVGGSGRARGLGARPQHFA